MSTKTLTAKAEQEAAQQAAADAAEQAAAAEAEAAALEARLGDNAAEVEPSAMEALNTVHSRRSFWRLRQQAAEKAERKAALDARREQVADLADRAVSEQGALMSTCAQEYDAAVDAIRKLLKAAEAHRDLVTLVWREARQLADVTETDEAHARQLGREAVDERGARVRVVKAGDPYAAPGSIPGHGSGVYVDGKQLPTLDRSGIVAELTLEATHGQPLDAHSSGPSARDVMQRHAYVPNAKD